MPVTKRFAIGLSLAITVGQGNIMKRAWAVFAALMLTYGCNSPTAPTPATVSTNTQVAANPNVIGTWSGTMRSQSGAVRSVRMTLTGAYSSSSYSISGNWAFTGTTEGADLSGLVQSNPFALRLNASTSSPSWCSYNVTITVSGNSANGDYSTSICSGRSTETGTISLSK